MTEPFRFINSSTPDADRPPIWRRGDATILASARGATGSPDYSPELPGRQRFARGSIFDTSENDGWREETFEVVSSAERKFYESGGGNWRPPSKGRR